MAWPPPVLPINRTNAVPQQDTHPADHNAVNLAVNDLVTRVQGNEIDAGKSRGFNISTQAELNISQYPSATTVLSFGFSTTYRRGIYNLWFTGQTWTNQDYEVRIVVNSALISSTRITSVANYSPLVAMTAAGLETNAVVVVQMWALSGGGGLRVGANLSGQLSAPY
jgi:hypothetical protein